MRNHWFSLLFLLILFFASVIAQESQKLLPEEFLAQYQKALEEKNEEIAKQLVKENEKIAKKIVEEVFDEAIDFYQTADYQKSIIMFEISFALFKHLGKVNKMRQTLGYIGKSYAAIGAMYAQKGEYEKALASYEQALQMAQSIKEQEGEASTLNSIGVLYTYQKKYEKALSFYEQALQIRNILKDKVGEASTLANIGLIYSKKGEYEISLTFFQKVTTIIKTISSKPVILRNIITTLNTIGQLCERENFNTALNFYQQALEIANDLGDKENKGTILNNIGWIYDRKDDCDTALSFYQQALEITNDLGSKESAILNNIGLIYEKKREHEKALSFYWKALEIKRAIRDQEGESTILNNIGLVYLQEGENEKSLELHQQALKISKMIGDKAGEGTTLNNIGSIYVNKGEYDAALNSYQQALQLIRFIENKPEEGNTLNNIAWVYHCRGEDDTAISFYQQALQKIDGIHAKAATLNNIGLLYCNKKEYEKALGYYEQALQIIKLPSDMSFTLNNIGLLYCNKKEYEKALGYYEQVLQIRKSIGEKTDNGATFNNMGIIYDCQREYKKALQFYQQAREIFQLLGQKADEYAPLSNIGFLYEQQKQWQEAVNWYEKAIVTLEQIRSKAGGREGQESLLAENIEVYPHIVKCFLQLKEYEKAFHYAERGKARSMAELLYESSIGVKKRIEPKLLQEEQRIYGNLLSISQQLKNSPSDKQRSPLLARQSKLELQLASVQRDIKEKNPKYSELKYPDPITLKDVQEQILQEGEVLVEYLQGEEEFYVFVIGKQYFASQVIPSKDQTSISLTDKIIELLESIHDFSNSHKPFDAELAYEVYQRLFQPLQEEIRKAANDKPIQALILIPDGILFYLPFEILVTKPGEKPEYLLQQYPIVYASSAQVLKTLSSQKTLNYTNDLLALAPCNKKDRSIEGGLAKKLEFSEQEIKNIAQYYPTKAVCKLNDEASRDFLLKNSIGNRYLHISTHGLLDADNPMYCGLVFPDGVLHTYEIFNMDIDAELVFLSACQTGLGKMKKGEGMVGLSRAFFYAGTHSLVVSLWKTADAFAPAFMKRFYGYIKNGKNKVEALRQTKLWMIEKSYHNDEKSGETIYHSHPYYWAPFILIGASK